MFIKAKIQLKTEKIHPFTGHIASCVISTGRSEACHIPKRSKLVFSISIFCGCVFVLCACGQAATLQKGPYLIYPNTNTEMTVLWQTDVTSGNSMIKWGKTTASEFSSGPLKESGGGSYEHQFSYNITGLDIATRYYYRVIVDAQEATGSFMSAPSNAAKSVTFYGYGDTRGSPDNHNSVVAQLMIYVDGDPDHRQTIILHSGDMVTNGDNEGDWADEYFNRSYPNSLDFMSRMPVMAGRGNHESSGVLLRKYWPYEYQDGNGCYYSFDYGPVHVTVIDQYVDLSPGSPQYNWLTNDLATTQKIWKFVILHEPAWSAGDVHENNTYIQQYLCPLFEQYGVAVVHAGHNHYYSRCVVNDVQYITAGGGGAPLYEPDPKAENLVMADESLNFIKYQISGGQMTVTAIRSDGSFIESLKVVKQTPINAMPRIP